MDVSNPILTGLLESCQGVHKAADFVECAVAHLWEHSKARCLVLALQDSRPPHDLLALSSRGLNGQAAFLMNGFAAHDAGAVRGTWPAELVDRVADGAVYAVALNASTHQQLTLVTDGQTDPEALALVVRLLALTLARDHAVRATQRIIQLFEGGPVVLIRRRNVPGWPVDEVTANVTREFGWTVEEFLGRSAEQRVHPEDLERVQKALSAALAQGKPYVAQSFRVIDAAGLTRDVFEFTHFVRDATGVVTHLHGYVFDDGDRRRSEQEKAARLEKLQQSRKIEAIGTLASGIAHDFNNVLAVILTSLELARLQPEVAVADTDLTAATMAAMRGRDMVRQLLVFGRSAAGSRVPCRLQKITQDALRQVNSILPQNITLHVTLDPAAGVVLADASQIEHLLLNLVTNAVAAMPRGGELDIAVRAVKAQREQVELMVKDNGEGMTAEVLARAFEPFFTTKPIGKGTGLGLAMVHAIARKHGGTVALESTPGRGTTVTISLPVAERAEVTPPAEHQRALAGAQGKKVAVVDDNPAVASSTSRLVSHFGYQVTSLSGAAAALSMFEANPDAFDLVLTDQSMPEMSGLELGQALRAHGIQVPVLLVTGLPDEIDPAAVSAPFVVLGKPYRSEELGQALVALFERTSAVRTPS